jgi:hypothetical protein
MAIAHVGEYPVGSLVRIREMDWIVLPSDDSEIICLRPPSGSVGFQPLTAFENCNDTNGIQVRPFSPIRTVLRCFYAYSVP